MIIGLTGKKLSGKSTAAKYIQEKYNTKRLNFKDGLIQELKKNFPDLLRYYQHLYGVLEIDELFAVKEPPIRFLMQNYGTEVRRVENPDHWVDQWKKKAVGDIVCDDVRFLNEAKAVREAGGIIIRITRPDMQSTDTHTSEQEMDSIEPNHTIIVNTGEYDLLYQCLDALIPTLSTP